MAELVTIYRVDIEEAKALIAKDRYILNDDGTVTKETA